MDIHTTIHQVPAGYFFKPVPWVSQLVFFTCIALCLLPFTDAAAALLMGITMTWITGHPYQHLNSKATHLLLQFSVVGLGFGMNVYSALKATGEGALLTIGSIGLTFIAGYILMRVFKIEQKISYLITSGTAICGGSAIAAIAPVIKAGEKQVPVALGCVFLLNAAALFIFPAIGHVFHLSQTQFGLWCAVAIHDTSSVVGAAGKYGPQALEIATTVKLARALWIIPAALVSALIFKTGEKKIKVPYFILLFILAILISTYVPAIKSLSGYITTASKAALKVTLFLIGAGLTAAVLKGVGIKPLLLGLILWIIIASTSLFTIVHLAH